MKEAIKKLIISLKLETYNLVSDLYHDLIDDDTQAALIIAIKNKVSIIERLEDILWDYSDDDYLEQNNGTTD